MGVLYSKIPETVKSEIIEDSTRSTTVKNRYISDNNTLFRLTEINQENISKKLEAKILNKFKKIVKKIDILIFSDFNYGILTNSLIHQVIKIAKANSAEANLSLTLPQLLTLCFFPLNFIGSSIGQSLVLLRLLSLSSRSIIALSLK